ncbi:MAG: tRNA pseudouridine(38-40) synthase TruA [Ignavibacteriales bacterium]|nr:tRNA pseudouridine(38-40) synthase TruA [Ignavibacteriales bacterium]
MNNYKLSIQYDGSKFSGWQIQKNAISVQEKIKSAIEAILKEEIVLTGAGRTDTGVHALGQVANFKCEQEIDFYRFKYSLNSMLPFSIRIKKMESVPEAFNARYDAISRSYLYFIAYSPTPFNYQFVYNYHFQVDTAVLNQLSEPLIGVHDFSSFTKYAKERETFICDIKTIRWTKIKGIVVLFIEADRFLHGMVRAITGTLLMTAKSGGNKDQIIYILDAKNREIANASVPAKGLFLYKVKYPKINDI